MTATSSPGRIPVANSPSHQQSDRLRRAFEEVAWNAECVSPPLRGPLTFRHCGGMTEARPPGFPRRSARWPPNERFGRSRPPAAIAEGRHTRNARFAGLPLAPAGNCSENCRRGGLKVQQASTGGFCKPLKTQVKWHRVFTGDPHVRRQVSTCSQNALFSTAYVSSRWGLPIETC